MLANAIKLVNKIFEQAIINILYSNDNRYIDHEDKS